MKSTTATAIESLHIDNPIVLNDMAGRIAGDAYIKILRAKYNKADIHKEVMKNSLHLETAQRKIY